MAGHVTPEEMARLNEESRRRTAGRTRLEQARDVLGPDATEAEAEFLYEMGLL